MKRFILCLASLLITWTTVYAQAPGIDWQKCIGGDRWDVAFDIKQTSDGGYILAGYSDSRNGNVTMNKGDYDYWIVKLNSTGNIQWEKSYGGTKADVATSIEETSNGGYIVAGYSQSNDGDVGHNKGGRDIWVIRLDNNGNLIWSKALGGSGNEGAKFDAPLFASDVGTTCIKQTPDGGYILGTGSESTDGDLNTNISSMHYWIVKLNNTGNIVWEKSFGENSYCNSITTTSDGGYIAAGYGDVLKLNTQGVIEWQSSPEIAAHSIDQTLDGGYIVAGYVYNSTFNISYYAIAKLDDTGGNTWVKKYGGNWTNSESVAYSVQQVTDGNFIVAGFSWFNRNDTTYFNHGNRDCWIMKLDINGDMLWERCYGSGGHDIAYAIRQSSAGGFIVAGNTDHESGDVTGWHDNDDYWVIKLSHWPASIQNINRDTLSIHPNPNNGKFTVKTSFTNREIVRIAVTDIFGRKVKETTTAASGETIIELDVPLGVYFVTVSTETARHTEKVIVQ